MKALASNQPVSSGGIKIHDILYVVFKHKRKIVGLTLASLILAAIVGYFCLRTPGYETQAKLLVRYVVERNTSDPESPDRVGDVAINTELEILQSLDLAIETASRYGPEKLLPDHTPPVTAEDAAGRIMNGLLAEEAPKGGIIYLSYRDSDPKIAVGVLQNHIQSYFARHLKIHRSTEAFKQVAMQTSQAQETLRITEEEINRLKSKSGVLSIDATITEFESRRQVMRGLLMAAEAALAEQIAKVRSLERSYIAKAPKDAKASEKDDLTEAEKEIARRKNAEAVVEYQDILARLEVLQKERNQLLVRRPAHHPMVISLDRQIAAAQRQQLEISVNYPDIASRLDKGEKDEKTTTLEDEQALQKALEARVDAIAKQVKTVESEVDGLSELGFKLEGLERRKLMEEESYRMFQSRLEKARLDETLDPSRIPNIVVLQNPTAPIKSVDNTTKILLAGLAGSGLMLGFGVAFLKEWVIDRRISRPTEILARLQMPLMMSIPYIRSKEHHQKLGAGEKTLELQAPESEGALLVEESPKPDKPSPVSSVEQFIAPYAGAIHDRIIFNFQINNINHKPKLIALTAASPGAGVSTIASGLAKAFADDGNRKVLLVDLNAAMNGMPHSKQPADSLRRAIDIAKNQHFRESLRNLYFASAPMGRGNAIGSTPMTPLSLQEVMPTLLASEFDYIIFDMPHIEPTSPALSVAGFMDKVLLVVDGEKTTRDDLTWTYSELERCRADVSCIFNKARTHAPRWVENGA